MKLWKKGRFVPYLYAFALMVSLLLSGVSYYLQGQSRQGLESFYSSDLQFYQWNQLEKIHQQKMNALTRGFLSGGDLWKKDYRVFLERYQQKGREIKADENLGDFEKLISKSEKKLLESADIKGLTRVLKEQQREVMRFSQIITERKSQKKISFKEQFIEWNQLIQYYSWGSSLFFFFMLIFYQRTKRSEQKLIEEERKRDFMIDSLDSACFILNKDKKVIGVNEKVKQLWPHKGLWERTIDQALPFPNISEFFPVVFEKEASNHVEEVLFERSHMSKFLNKAMDGKPIRTTIQLRSLSATPLWFQVDLKSYKQELTLITLTEITELIHAMDLIQRQQENLIHQSKMSALGRLSGGMAHEINNPLAIISSEAEDLLDIAEEEGNVPKDEAVSISQNIKTTTSRISAIIKGLKIFSHQEEGIEKKPLLISTLLEEVSSLSGESMKAKAVEFSIHNSLSDKEATLFGNEIQLIQVMINLINNSMDAIENQNSKKIEIKLGETPHHYLFSFKDNGPGIATGIQKKVFDPFFTTKEVGKGTGLGLSLSQSIIKDHGGEMRVEDTKEGCLIVITLPKASEVEGGGESWAS